MTHPRRWTAILETRTEQVPAELSTYDTQREMLKAACAEAAELVRAGLASEVWVSLYKTTKAHGTQQDVGAWVGYDQRDRLVVAR